VELNGPVSPGQYDALVAVQPSSLGPEQFTRLVDAVRSGVPTAIFEDPMPFAQGFIPGTGAPKQAPGGMFGGGAPAPKGDIRQLWEVLELDVPGRPNMMAQGLLNPSLVWQQWNPYPNLDMNVNSLWLFVDAAWRHLDNPDPSNLDLVQRAFLGQDSRVRVWYAADQIVGLVVEGS
jgi:ABC-2 type transport system permease protein